MKTPIVATLASVAFSVAWAVNPAFVTGCGSLQSSSSPKSAFGETEVVSLELAAGKYAISLESKDGKAFKVRSIAPAQ